MRLRDLFKETIESLSINAGHLATALLAPFCLLVLAEIIQAGEFDPVVGWAAMLLSLLMDVFFAITTHRIVLLGKNSVPKWGSFKWSLREFVFLGYLVGVSLIPVMSAMLTVIPVIGKYLIILFIPLTCWIISRLSLVFPGVAVDKGVTLKLSWKLTKDHQLLMVLVVIMSPILMLLPAMLLSFIPFSNIFISIIQCLVVIFQVALLSVTYKNIMQVSYTAD